MLSETLFSALVAACDRVRRCCICRRDAERRCSRSPSLGCGAAYVRLIGYVVLPALLVACAVLAVRAGTSGGAARRTWRDTAHRRPAGRGAAGQLARPEWCG